MDLVWKHTTPPLGKTYLLTYPPVGKGDGEGIRIGDGTDSQIYEVIRLEKECTNVFFGKGQV